MYQPFFTLSSCYKKYYVITDSYTSPHNQAVVATVIKEVNVRHPSVTEDNLKEWYDHDTA